MSADRDDASRAADSQLASSETGEPAPKSTLADEIGAKFTKVLNRHGFGFQYGVMRIAEYLHDRTGESPWRLVASEYPVVAGAENDPRIGTHLDFVYVCGSPQQRIYLVAECKRVNPALGRWCFARSPYTWFNPDPDELIFDELRAVEGYAVARVPIVLSSPYRKIHVPVCELAKEIRTNLKGDDGPTESRAIEEAVSQVLRGAGGLLNRMRLQPTYWARCVPVIFTTAELWVSEADISDVTVSTGELATQAKVERHDWIWFNYNRSPAISPAVPMAIPADDDPHGRDSLATFLRWDSARSIAIVSPTGIEKFLSSNIADVLFQFGQLPLGFPK